MNTLWASRNEASAKTGRRAVSRPVIISLAVHLVLGVVLARYLISPSTFIDLFGRQNSAEVPAERIGFLRLPKAEGTPVVGKSGGDNLPAVTAPRRPLIAPTVVPSSIPEQPPASSAAEPAEGSGPLVGTGGPARGIRPTYSDPRLWSSPGDLVAAPKSATQRLDSAILSIVRPFNDSLAVAAGQRQPGDWTFERGGRKYGIDPQYIRLGKLSIPTALLALLPLNANGNPTVNDRNRLQNRLHSDIFWQAQRGMNEADFKKAVRSIRERKERERAAEAKKTRPANPPAAEGPPGGL